MSSLYRGRCLPVHAAMHGGWEVRSHPVNKLPYFVNKRTRQVMWECPPELGVRVEDAWMEQMHPTHMRPFYVNMVCTCTCSTVARRDSPRTRMGTMF
jgi:hypothetical protein